MANQTCLSNIALYGENPLKFRYCVYLRLIMKKLTDPTLRINIAIKEEIHLKLKNWVFLKLLIKQ